MEGEAVTLGIFSGPSFRSIGFDLAPITQVDDGSCDAEIVTKAVFFVVSEVRHQLPVIDGRVLHPEGRKLLYFSLSLGLKAR